MNKDNAAQYLPLVQALAEGRVIQCQYYPFTDRTWGDCSEITFSDDISRYRIKPEPRKAWVWWPSLPNHALYHMRLYSSHEAASEAVRRDGGHITEVTE